MTPLRALSRFRRTIAAIGLKLFSRASGHHLLLAAFFLPATSAEAAAPFTTVKELQAINYWDVRYQHPIQLSGVVTLVDATRRMVVLEDPTGAVAVAVDQIPASIVAGQRVTLTAPDCQPYFAALPDYPDRPTRSSFLPNLETVPNQAQHYIARLRAYLHPPRTGTYSFWIASDDTSELWLSSTAQTGDATRIALVNSWTKPRDWGASAMQHSPPITLEAGKPYYLEVLHEQRDGDDNLSVAWAGPGLSQQVVAGEYLSPWRNGESENGGKEAQSMPVALPSDRVTRDIWQGAAVDGVWRLTSDRKFKSFLTVAKAEFTTLGRGTFPLPRSVQIEQPLSADDLYRWSAVQGTVDFVAQENDSLILNLFDGEKRLRAVIQHWKGGEPQRIKHRQVRFEGVAEASLNAAGEPVLGTLWVSTADRIQAMDPAPVSTQFRPTTISELQSVDERWSRDQPVSLSGEVFAGAGTRELVLRDSGTFAGYVSEDGVAWQPLGPTADIPMGPSVYAGLAVNSNSNQEVATATFDSVTGLSPEPQSSAIGLPPASASLTASRSTFVVKDQGQSIWDIPDQFHFSHQRLDGAGEFIARIVDFKTTELNAKAGIMMRENLEPDAQFVSLVHTRGNGVQLQWRRKAEGVGPKSTLYHSMQPPFWLKLARRYSTIKVTLDKIPDVTPGQIVTVIGYPASQDGISRLVDASCRISTEELKGPPTWSRPLLEIAKISEAFRPPNNLDMFRVRGVVTFSGDVDGHHYLAVQDGTGGTFIHSRDNLINPLAQVGQWLEIHSNPGWHPPSADFFADNIIGLGLGLEPRPLRHPLEYLLPRQGEGSWIEIEGIVRSVGRSGVMQVKQNGETLAVFVNQTPRESLTSWIDALVRIRGVISFPNEKEPLLLVPGLKHIEMVEATSAHSSTLPAQAISAFTSTKLINQSLHRVKITGTVIGQERDFIYVQKDGAGARIETDSIAPLPLGEEIEAVGFPDSAEDKSLTLANASVRRLGAGKQPEASVVTLDELSGGKSSGKLVRVEAILQGNSVTDTDQLVELHAGQRTIRATLTGLSPLLPSPPAGSLVAVTGLGVPDTSRSAWLRHSGDQPELLPIKILLRSPDDVVVLQKPRWWVVKRTLLITAITGLGCLLVSWWIHLLRHRVAQRTTELANAMAKLKRETQMAATLAERDRLAGEIHDSLAQGFNGLILQLDTTAKLSDCPDDVRSGLSLARSMVAFSRTEVQHAVWDLQSPLLEDANLGTALTKMAEQLSTETPRISIALTGAVRTLPSTIEHHLLRIAQEAITNSIKHAEARVIEVIVHYSPTEVNLSIRDDGRGFVTTQIFTAGLSHFGLRSLRGRAKKIGGEMTIASEPGRGTVVTIQVPTVTE